jgi:hypothetical protein
METAVRIDPRTEDKNVEEQERASSSQARIEV